MIPICKKSLIMERKKSGKNINKTKPIPSFGALMMVMRSGVKKKMYSGKKKYEDENGNEK